MFHIPFSSLSANEISQLTSEKLKGEPEEWGKNIWQFLNLWFDSSAAVIQVRTSGSTGNPKLIEHSKTAMLHSAKLTCEALDLKPGMNCLLCLPANKISGMMMIVRCIYNKMDLRYIRPSANPLKEISSDAHFDFAAFTPMQLFDISKNLEHFSRVEKISKIIIGGAGISSPLLKSISLMGNDVYETFGMTETISHIALRKLNGVDASSNFKLLHGITISTGDDGQVIIEAPELNTHHLVTNDVARIISPSEFEWLGRTDNVINSGGLKIHPEEIEGKLMSYIHTPFFISSVPDDQTGEKIVLVLEKHHLTENENKELKKAVTVLESVYRPRAIILVPRFIQTNNAKVKRRESLQQNTKVTPLIPLLFYICIHVFTIIK